MPLDFGYTAQFGEGLPVASHELVAGEDRLALLLHHAPPRYVSVWMEKWTCG